MHKKELYIEELSDSIQMLQNKAPKSMLFFSVFIICLFTIGIIITYIGKIEDTITISGEINNNIVDTIVSTKNGTIERIVFSEGEHVFANTQVILLDTTVEERQKTQLLEKLKQKEVQRDNYIRLKTDFEKKECSFANNNDERSFYDLYMLFASEVDNIERDSNLTDAQKKDQIKKSLLNYNIQINEVIGNIEEEIFLLQQEIELCTIAINDAFLYTQAEGKLHFATNISQGQFVTAGQELVQVFSETTEPIIKCYVPERYISKIELGNDVSCYPLENGIDEYESILGTISNVGDFPVIDETTGQKYYIVDVQLKTNVVRTKKNEEVFLKEQMTFNIDIIKNEKSILSWILDFIK